MGSFVSVKPHSPQGGGYWTCQIWSFHSRPELYYTGHAYVWLETNWFAWIFCSISERLFQGINTWVPLKMRSFWTVISSGYFQKLARVVQLGFCQLASLGRWWWFLKKVICFECFEKASFFVCRQTKSGRSVRKTSNSVTKQGHSIVVLQYGIVLGEQGWRSGKSARRPPMFWFRGSIPGLSVISGLSLLVLYWPLYSAPRGFYPGTAVFPSLQKLTFDLIWFGLNCKDFKCKAYYCKAHSITFTC